MKKSGSLPILWGTHPTLQQAIKTPSIWLWEGWLQVSGLSQWSISQIWSVLRQSHVWETPQAATGVGSGYETWVWARWWRMRGRDRECGCGQRWARVEEAKDGALAGFGHSPQINGSSLESSSGHSPLWESDTSRGKNEHCLKQLQFLHNIVGFLELRKPIQGLGLWLADLDKFLGNSEGEKWINEKKTLEQL